MKKYVSIRGFELYIRLMLWSLTRGFYFVVLESARRLYTLVPFTILMSL